MKKLVMIVVMLLIGRLAYADSLLVQGGLSHTSNSNYDDGGAVVARLEHKVSQTLSIGIEGAYHGPQDHRSEDGTNLADLSGYSLLGEAIYYPPVAWKVKPYLLGGLGYSWWSFDEAEALLTAPGPSGPGIEVDGGSALAYKVALGADYPISSNWSLNLEASFFKASVPLDAHYTDGSYSNVIGNDDRSGHRTIGQEEISVMVGVRYSW